MFWDCLLPVGPCCLVCSTGQTLLGEQESYSVLKFILIQWGNLCLIYCTPPAPALDYSMSFQGCSSFCLTNANQLLSPLPRRRQKTAPALVVSREAKAEGHPRHAEETNGRARIKPTRMVPTSLAVPHQRQPRYPGGDHHVGYQVCPQHDGGAQSFTSNGPSITCPIFLCPVSLPIQIAHKAIPLLVSLDSLPWHHGSYSGRCHGKEQHRVSDNRMK